MGKNQVPLPPTKKGLKKKRQLQETPYRYTPAQEVMREDMLGGEPIPLADVLDETLGAHVGAHEGSGPAVTDVALDIISGFDLVLSMAQWQVVQEMVEAGVRAGYRFR
jgi:hypothetical protein